MTSCLLLSLPTILPCLYDNTEQPKELHRLCGPCCTDMLFCLVFLSQKVPSHRKEEQTFHWAIGAFLVKRGQPNEVVVVVVAEKN